MTTARVPTSVSPHRRASGRRSRKRRRSADSFQWVPGGGGRSLGQPPPAAPLPAACQRCAPSKHTSASVRGDLHTNVIGVLSSATDRFSLGMYSTSDRTLYCDAGNYFVNHF